MNTCATERDVPEGSAVGVFPGGEGLCARLGLETLPNGYQGAASQFAAMRDDLVSRFDHRGCVTADEGADLAREVLVQHGFDDWRVVVDQPVGGEVRFQLRAPGTFVPECAFN